MKTQPCPYTHQRPERRKHRPWTRRRIFIPALTNVLNQKMSALLFAATLIASTLGPAPYAIRPVAAVHGTERLTLSMSTGQTGTDVTVSGSGFFGNTSGFVYFDQNFDYLWNVPPRMCGPLSEQQCEPRVEVLSDSTGKFTTSIRIPPGMKADFLGAGTYIVQADLPIGGGPERSVPFIVPATLDVGRTVRGVPVSGSKFAPYNINGTPSQGLVWVDSNNNLHRDSHERAVQVYVLPPSVTPGGPLSGCPSSLCPITIPRATPGESKKAKTVRVDILHEADTNRSVQQKVEASTECPEPC